MHFMCCSSLILQNPDRKFLCPPLIRYSRTSDRHLFFEVTVTSQNTQRNMMLIHK